MMPAIYGNAYEIVQAPEYVAIRYEMIHETDHPARWPPPHRIGRARIPRRCTRALGGQLAVIETTNFTDRTHFGYNNRYNSEKFTLTERFTRRAEHVAVAGHFQRS